MYTPYKHFLLGDLDLSISLSTGHIVILKLLLSRKKKMLSNHVTCMYVLTYVNVLAQHCQFCFVTVDWMPAVYMNSRLLGCVRETISSKHLTNFLLLLTNRMHGPLSL